LLFLSLLFLIKFQPILAQNAQVNDFPAAVFPQDEAAVAARGCLFKTSEVSPTGMLSKNSGVCFVAVIVEVEMGLLVWQ